MTDDLLEQIRQLVEEYNSSQTMEKETLVKRTAIEGQLRPILHDIYVCQCDFLTFVKSNTEVEITARPTILNEIAIRMHALKEKEVDLKQQYSKINTQYRILYPVTNKLRQKIYKLQKQYWLSLNLHVS